MNDPTRKDLPSSNPKMSVLSDAIAECLERIEADGSSAIEAVCARYPTMAEDIRRRIQQLGEIGLIGVIGSARDDASASMANSSLDFMLEVENRRENHQRYEIKGEVARGGMGAVLKVYDNDLRRHLAMKVILDESSGSTNAPVTAVPGRALSRFLEEAQITGNLEHPGIIPVHELGLDSGKCAYFTMRLVKGQDLRQVLKQLHKGEGEWTQTRVLGVLLRACEAMAYVHSKNIVHRDLKPANIMIGKFGETYVMDWGLAKIEGVDDATNSHQDSTDDATESVVTTSRASSSKSDAYTMDGAVLGTPAYMPPEQAEGRIRDVGPSSDVYAFGAILYELIAGQAPYTTQGERASAHTVLKRVVEGPPRPIVDIVPNAQPELVAICEKAMRRDATKRYPHMQELASDLRAFLEDRVVKAYRTGAIVEFKKWVRRNKTTAAASALALISIIGGLSATAILQGAHTTEIRGKNTQINNVNVSLAVSLDRYNRMADVGILNELVGSSKDLWPRRPAQVPGMTEWLEKARRLVDRLPTHKETLEQLGVNESAQSKEERWQAQVYAELVRGIQALKGSGANTIEDMTARLTIARDVERETLKTVEEAWDIAMDEILDTEAYDELEIAPQIGLIPLGADPLSGLQEFWLWESGESPTRDQTSERYIIEENTGMVFVLIPGGEFMMGSSKSSGESNYDPEALDEEGPVYEVNLDPFFLSKYEMTQRQWLRMTYQNPSAIGKDTRYGSHITLAHPVERVSWLECQEVLSRLGLELPTEAQWEYAIRAGTTTPWSTGLESSSLEGSANVADEYARTHGGAVGAVYEAWSDGYVNHSPVGILRANGFGIHDGHGNVWEWCRDCYSSYAYFKELRAGDGLRLVDPPINVRAWRGGGYSAPARAARSAVRIGFVETTKDFLGGVRPSRRLEKQQ